MGFIVKTYFSFDNKINFSTVKYPAQMFFDYYKLKVL